MTGLIDNEGEIVDVRSTDPSYYSRYRHLKRKEILIVSLADRYDALRSPRHYKEGFSHEKTCEILRLDDRSDRKGEDIFGPELFSIFEKINEEMRNIYDNLTD